ncbi:hypothetical protein [Hymenobacter metallilatus]|uniref:Glycosyltransferase RgtA/B/C/D-like domain-containing protein n=1 Tax=Hymenobacter metallilatus TaxID=2493666 RepID=A0A428JF21_9BACT|nr:hypothetical protein [Hymenobacter metallilatus]RSK31160.1 hypothetical protein EI290_14155 [Hymenobacter metallilatus]
MQPAEPLLLSAPAPRRWYSLVALLLLAVLMVQARLLAPYWDTRNVQAILTWDAMGYYLYLPAKFIYHDVRYLRFVPDIMREYGPSSSFYQAFPAPGLTDGTLVMKYPIGVAVLEFPFFWLGHWAAALLGYPQDGFSAPYQVAIAFGGIAYGVLGLAVLRKVLLSFFSDAVAALTLGLVVLGTNYFQYAVFDAAMSHTYGFTLYALLLWCTVRWHRRPALGWAAGIGLALGLLVLTRPSEAVAVLLPLLWGIDSGAALRAKGQLLRRRWLDVLVLAACGAVALLPQLLYWHALTGSFIVYSYQEQGFSFLHPHLREVLISFKKGWLVYTPLMLLLPLGLAALFRQNRGMALTVLAYGAATLWVVAAWDIWWYGGSFGQRAMVSSYAALSLPLAALLAWCWVPGWRRVVGLWVLLPLLVGLLDLNLFQHWQYMYGIIHPEEMTRPYYEAVFSKARLTQDDYALLDVPTRIGQVTTHFSRRTLAVLDFEGQPPADDTGISRERGSSSGQSARIGGGKQFSPPLVVTVGAAGLQPGSWVRASGQVYSDWGAWNDQLVLAVERQGKSVQYHAVRLQNNGCVNKAWNDIWFDVPLAAVQPTDELRVYGLSNNGSVAFLDNLRLELLTPQPTAGVGH